MYLSIPLLSTLLFSLRDSFAVIEISSPKLESVSYAFALKVSAGYLIGFTFFSLPFIKLWGSVSWLYFTERQTRVINGPLGALLSRPDGQRKEK